MATNWNLLQMPDIGQAFQQGQEMRRQSDGRNALATYAADPNEQSLNALSPYNPQFVVQAKQQQAQQQQEQQAAAEQKRSQQLPVIGRLLDQANDETSYQQVLGVARQGGLDISTAPPTYDPVWVNNTKALLKASQTPEGRQALTNYGKLAVELNKQPGTPEFIDFVMKAWQADQIKTIPYQAGGGVAGYNPATGQTNTIIAPNAGGYAAGTPVGSAPVQKSIGGKTYEKRGDQWFEVGGGSSNATGGFQP